MPNSKPSVALPEVPPSKDLSYYHASTWDLPMIRQIARHAISDLEDVEFDGFACRGVSGLRVAAILAEKMEKDLVVVRKKGEDCHACEGAVEGVFAGQRLVIVDDFIGSGTTINTIRDQTEGKGAGIIGVWLYRASKGCTALIEKAQLKTLHTRYQSSEPGKTWKKL